MTSTPPKLPDFPIPLQLTRQERQILSLIAQGYANRQIAKMLALAPSTIKNHASNIFKKLEVPDRTNAAIWVWRSAYDANVRMVYEQLASE